MDCGGYRLIETVQTFGTSARLVGILTDAEGSARAASRPAVVLLNSGLLHRVGPNRLYVLIARALAAAGHDCFRFDFSGIGDSSVRTDALPVEESGIAETKEAMNLLEEQRGHRRFILAGICSGGYFSFRTARRDERVAGLVLLNVRGHLGNDNAEEQRVLEERAMRLHYRRIAFARSYRLKNILKVMRGQFDLRGALRSLSRRQGGDGDGSDPTPTDTSALDRLCERGVRILNIYSEGDWSLDYLTACFGDNMADRLSQPGSRFELLYGVNHIFSLLWSQDHLLAMLSDWATTTDWGPA